jgi:tRNA pseudouridine38-40 synthase
MPRLKFTIAYDGSPWKGWQSQPGGGSVQDQLEGALQSLVGQRVVIHGSGRTDAGVHAQAQVAHIDPPESMKLTSEAWVRALNVRLPHSIRILRCEEVADDFHARFDATGKVYEYRIWRATVQSPFEADRAWHLYGPLDMDALRAGAEALRGTHNFARLSANRGDITEVERRENADGLTRTISRVEVHEQGDILRLEFEGDGFLYKMVRLMMGTLIQLARGRETLEWVSGLVTDPAGEKSSHCAPADGLYLVRVLY